MTYDPKGNARDRQVDRVRFHEAEPPAGLSAVVHRFLDLATEEPLDSAYRFHALPDACTYIVFDQRNPDVTGVTRLRATSAELDLGRDFHFVNVRLLPGVWQADRSPVAYGQIVEPYHGDLPLRSVNRDLIGRDFVAQQEVLVRFITELAEAGLVVANPVTDCIFRRLDSMHSVADMAAATGLSARQLQRVLKRTTGFQPHDFLKVLRLQQSLDGEPSLAFADQSHFIHAFRKATGYTPGQWGRKFDV